MAPSLFNRMASDHSRRAKLVWAMYGCAILFTVIYIILGFFAWRDIAELSSETSSYIFDGCKTTRSDWSYLFSGLAWASGIGLIGIMSFAASSLLLMSCSLKSLSHPGRGFARGFVAGSALFSCLLSLATSLHLRSFENVIESFSAEGAHRVNMSLVEATVAFGVMSAIWFFLLFFLVAQWKDTTVPVAYGDEFPSGLYPTGPSGVGMSSA